MTNPWQLYDDLIDGLPGGITVADVVLSHFAAIRTSEGTVGLAMADQGGPRPASLPRVVGAELREVAGLVKSWDLGLASIGVAALNSWYNTEAHVESSGATLVAPDTDGFRVHADRVAGKTVGMIGHFAGIEHFDRAKKLIVLERQPQRGDYPDSACEYELADCEQVYITGTTLANKTLPRLLELSRHARTVLVGPTTPFAPDVYGPLVQEVDSSWVNDPDRCWELAKLGAPMREMREIFTRFNAVFD